MIGTKRRIGFLRYERRKDEPALSTPPIDAPSWAISKNACPSTSSAQQSVTDLPTTTTQSNIMDHTSTDPTSMWSALSSPANQLLTTPTSARSSLQSSPPEIPHSFLQSAATPSNSSGCTTPTGRPRPREQSILRKYPAKRIHELIDDQSDDSEWELED